MTQDTRPPRGGLIAQTITQVAIFAAMLLGAILIVSQQEHQAMTIEVPVEIGTPVVEYPEPTIPVGRTLASPGGRIEGWWD
ncbi:MAG: hypothetical protein KJN71_03400 [Acidimicrobiia bacterium]|nr:hypothetical protein [Acidimicrobiia bacterium]